VFPPNREVTASNMNYAVVGFGVMIIISTVQWFVDGRLNYKGPTFDEFAFATIEGRDEVERGHPQIPSNKE
jgi:hypothetical protein